MFSDYWWVFVIGIIVLMIVWPKKKSKNNSNKGPNLKLEPFLSNLNTITSYYVGLN
jgi:hypothetical protein